MPLHQIKARSRARIFRDPPLERIAAPIRYRADMIPYGYRYRMDRGEAEHSFAGTPPRSRIDPGRFTAGIDLIDD